jgi:hypothetical protein
VRENVYRRYKRTIDAEERSDCATFWREHGVAWVTDLSIIMLNAELIRHEVLKTWIDAAKSAAERESRKQAVQALICDMT